MSGIRGSVLSKLGFALTLLAATSARSESVSPDKLPAPVSKTFWGVYPQAQIQKLDVEAEEGVMVYDFEFKDGEAEKETDIAGDGTQLEHTLVVQAAAVPEAAMKAIRSAAKSAKIVRIERIEISYKTEEGKAIKLPEIVTHYAADLVKGKRKSEVVVNPDGSLVEQTEWTAITAPKPATQK